MPAAAATSSHQGSLLVAGLAVVGCLQPLNGCWKAVRTLNFFRNVSAMALRGTIISDSFLNRCDVYLMFLFGF